MEKLTPDFEEIAKLIDEKREKFEMYYRLLLEYNGKFNLTAVTERDEVFHKHFLDSLAGVGFFKRNAVCAEVGSGAGFPSIPLKLVREDLAMTLIESTGKKCDFLRAAVRELDLDNVEVVHARAEELAREETYRERYDVCFARAVAPLSTLSEYCIPFVREGGIFLAYKSDNEEELALARPAMKVLGTEYRGCVAYELPDGYGARRLYSCQKVRPTPAKYPRGNGKERRDPIR